MAAVVVLFQQDAEKAMKIMNWQAKLPGETARRNRLPDYPVISQFEIILGVIPGRGPKRREPGIQ